MSDKFFLDTGVFVNSFDFSQPEKKAIATDLIKLALSTGAGVISSQVIQEFMNIALRKFIVPMKIEDCKEYQKVILAPLCRIYPDIALFELAVNYFAETQYSFYDSMILAAAKQAGVKMLYSEDFQNGQMIGDIKIINPFDKFN